MLQSFHDKIIKPKAARAFAVFVGQIGALLKYCRNFSNLRFSEFLKPAVSDKLKYTNQLA